MFSSPAARRCLAALAVAIAALVPFARPAAAQTCTTSITGTVYAPNGIDPLPNILVYVPTTAVQPFTNGVVSCAASLQLVSGNPLVGTQTDAAGSFKLTSPGLAGSNIPIVIQAGKWRRQFVVPAVPACASTSFTARMPQNHTEGDIPQFAIVTGAADSVECAIRKVGIADSEFTNPGGSGRINLYTGIGASGALIDSATPSETALIDNPATMNGFDIIMLPCQGSANAPRYTKTAAEQANLINFTDIGGRMFATHFSYVWLYNDPPFQQTADWTNNNVSLPDGVATISSSFTDAQTLAQWLVNVGASTTYGQVPLLNTKQNQTGVNPPAQTWFNLNDPAAGNPSMQFTFDTPITGTTLPNIAVNFTNNPSTFITGDPADTILINVADTSTTAADSTLALNIQLAQGLTATALAGSAPSTGWTCVLSSLSCSRKTPLPGGTSDPLTLTVAVGPNATTGNVAAAKVTVSGGGLSNTNQCGRVLYNEYHVETPVRQGKAAFPDECNPLAKDMTPQEKLLEYSLFDLSNFVATDAVDTVHILQPSSLSLLLCVDPPGSNFPCGNPITSTPLISPITMFYGQTLDGVAIESSTNWTGTISFFNGPTVFCTINANLQGGSNACPTVAPFPAGTNTVYASYTGDTNFEPATSNGIVVTVFADPTTIAVTSSLNPAVTGAPVTFLASVTGNFATPNGTVTFLDGATVLATVTLDALGNASFTTSSLPVGINPITVRYSGNNNFLGSVSGVLNEIITLPPPSVRSAITLTSSVNPAAPAQQVVFTATVSAPGPFATIPGGVVTFLDGSTVLASSPIDPVSGIATYVTSTLAPGAHPITATFAGQPSTGTGTPVNPPTPPKPVNPHATPPAAPGMRLSGPTAATAHINFGPAYDPKSNRIPSAAATPFDRLEFFNVLSSGVAPAAEARSATAPPRPSFVTPTILPSTSAVLIEIITSPGNPEPTGFTLTVSPTPVSVQAGRSAVMLVTVRAISGFKPAVALTCSGLPTETTCTFVQPLIPSGGGATTLYLTTSAPRNCGTNGSYFANLEPATPSGQLVHFARRSAPISIPAVFAGTFLLAGLRRRRIRSGIARSGLLSRTLMLLLLSLTGFLSLTALSGCSGNCTDLGTRPSVYTFTVVATAQDNSAAQSQTIPLTVTIP